MREKRGSCLKWLLNELGLFCGWIDLLSTSTLHQLLSFIGVISFLFFSSPYYIPEQVRVLFLPYVRQKGRDETICGTINELFDLQTGPQSTGQIDTLLTVVAFVVGTAMCPVSYTGVVPSIAQQLHAAITTIRDSATAASSSSPPLDQRPALRTLVAMKR